MTGSSSETKDLYPVTNARILQWLVCLNSAPFPTKPSDPNPSNQQQMDRTAGGQC